MQCRWYGSNGVEEESLAMRPSGGSQPIEQALVCVQAETCSEHVAYVRTTGLKPVAFGQEQVRYIMVIGTQLHHHKLISYEKTL